jgi:hypothetical protein
MGSVNRCSMFANRCLTFITASMTVMGEKLSGGSADQLAVVLEIVWGTIFLESSKVRLTLLDQHERL